MSEQQQLLSDLCSVCYTEKPKYRCPRCKTQTCSLPCYKRHQQRASCNGQRDPAAYVKKSAWATPAGIDHDYNYLKSVERRIDRAGQEVHERGIDQNSGSNRNVTRARQPESGLQKYLFDNRIHVEKAPKGMSRERANKTRITQKGRLFWSLEWIDVDGSRFHDDDGLEGETIDELFAAVEARKRNAARKQQALRVKSEPSVKKRKTEVSSQPDKDLQPTEASETASDTQISTDNGAEKTGFPSQTAPGQDAPSHELPVPGEEDVTIITEPQRSFYLLNATAASSSKVLVPLNAAATLTECLKGRTVKEYPTIYVLPQALDSPPAGFQWEADYLKVQRAEEAEVEGMLQATRGEMRNRQREDQQQGDDGLLDANSILDMLKRDVRV